MIPSVLVAPVVEKVRKKPGKRDAALLLLISWLIPLCVHFLPWSGPAPLQDYVLPFFWMTLAGVYVYGTGVGLLIGLSSPLVTYLVIGFPDTTTVALTALQISIFVFTARGLIGRAPGFWWVAPFAYLAGTAAAYSAQIFLPGFPGYLQVSVACVESLQTALPGMAILAFIHFMLVRLYPQPDDWDAT